MLDHIGLAASVSDCVECSAAFVIGPDGPGIEMRGHRQEAGALRQGRRPQHPL
ncbi:MAG: hypothetical protein KKD25_16105 [Gammaproteobacteria bacterium]|nr:hypothetical protein [Gammaproteobacteria bacterium]MBU0772064.1 hypothetical protein [Gammaproteobacteria bacterium]MBU0856387.1 hypothetical protein [Gammaproteobacteria bacterium]MBU1845855.1 hypothetical protein [Gammaproteobacteria bacterium]